MQAARDGGEFSNLPQNQPVSGIQERCQYTLPVIA